MAKIIKIELDLDDIIDSIKEDTAESVSNEDGIPRLTLKDYVLKQLQYQVSNKVSEANIKCAFMHWWFHNKFGYFTAPVGMTWFHETTEESYNDYIKQYQPLFKAYGKWIEKRR